MKKTILYFASAILIICVLAFLAASPLLKYLLQRYDLVYLGRELKIESVRVNILTGRIKMNNVKLFELNSDKVFISARSITSNISILKLISNEFNLAKVEIDHPDVNIKKNRFNLNYDDLVIKMENANKQGGFSMKFNWDDVLVTSGKLLFQEDSIAIKCGFKNINLEVKKTANKKGLDLNFEFENGLGSGSVKGVLKYLLSDKRYQLALQVKKYDMNIVDQYFKVLIPDVRFRAILDADFKSKGILGKKEDVTNSGLIRITNLHCGTDSIADYLSFRELELSLREISPKKKIFAYDSVIIKYPYINYVKYNHLDNFQNFFGINGSKITRSDSTDFNLVTELTAYLKMLSRNFKKSDYLVDRFRVESGELNVTDHSEQRQFYMRLYPINLAADKISKKNRRIHASLNVHVSPSTNLNMSIGINPINYKDFEIHYNMKGLPLVVLNPYLTALTSFPFEKGILDCDGNWHVDNGNIESQNHLILHGPKLMRRVKGESTNKIPMRMLFRLMRNNSGIVESDLPITGNLSDPKFELKKAVWDAMMHSGDKTRSK